MVSLQKDGFRLAVDNASADGTVTVDYVPPIRDTQQAVFHLNVFDSLLRSRTGLWLTPGELRDLILELQCLDRRFG